MKSFEGYCLIGPEALQWRLSNLMRIPNADYLERTGSEHLGARLWRLPPRSANTLHKHIRSEEFYVVLEGTGRIRVGDTTLTVGRYGGVLVGPERLRQVFNDTAEEVLWLIVGGPEEIEFLKGSLSTGMDLSKIYPTDPKTLPRELAGVVWPPVDPPEASHRVGGAGVEVTDYETLTREWIEAWNQHDLERILAHYAPGVEFVSPFVSRILGGSDGVIRGRDALREYFRRGLETYPDLRFEWIRVYAGVRSCVLEYRSVNGLRAAETMEFDAAGRVCRVRAHYGE